MSSTPAPSSTPGGAGVEEPVKKTLYRRTFFYTGVFYTGAGVVVFPGAGSGRVTNILAGRTTNIEAQLYPPNNG